MLDIDRLIDSIIFGGPTIKNTIYVQNLPIEESFLINIIAPRTIKRIPSIAFCFEVERRIQELILSGDLYLTDVEVMDNIIKWFRKFPPSQHRPALLYMARAFFTNFNMKFIPNESTQWKWFGTEFHQQISDWGSTFHRIDTIRKYQRYVPISERKKNQSQHLKRRAALQRVRHRIINKPPKPNSPLLKNPLFVKSKKTL